MSRRRIGEVMSWEETINGHVFTLTVNTGTGAFSTVVAGDRLHAQTKDELLAAIKRVTKRHTIKVAVPVTQLDRVLSQTPYQRDRWVSGVGVRHLTLTGKHAKTGHLLWTDGEESGQFSSQWDVGDLVQRLNADEVAQYVTLATAKRQSAQAYEQWLKRVTWCDHVDRLVENAIAAKIDTPQEDEDDA